MQTLLKRNDGICKADIAAKLLLAGIRRGRNCLARSRCILANLGDIAVAKAMDSAFKDFIFFDHVPKNRYEVFYPLIFPRRHFFDDFCLGGGTLIFSPLDTSWSLSLEDLMRRERCRFLFTFGSGVRDPDFFRDIDRTVERTWLMWLQRCQYVSVRGSRSLEILKSRGIENVEVVGDPALVYSRDKILTKPKRKRIGLNISQSHQFFGDNKSQALEVFIDLIKYLLHEEWVITLFSTSAEDVELSRMLIKDLGPDSINTFENYWDISGCMDLLEEQDIFVGTKLHSIILSYCVYTPALMIAYQPKCLDFIETADMSRYAIRTDMLNARGLVERALEIYENSEDIQRRQFSICQEYKGRLNVFIEKVRNIKRDK